MFNCNIDLVIEILQKELGGDAGDLEIFYEIHCPDPFDKKQEFVFPAVAVHATGLYLVLLWDSPKNTYADSLSKTIEYACRVFKSYFFTTVPIHSVFVFEKQGRSKVCLDVKVYDFVSKHFVSEGLCSLDDLTIYVQKSGEDDINCPSEDEWDNLISRLTREESESLVVGSENKDCFVKRSDKWFPAFNDDSDKVFNLALFGGFFGLHRFHLGLYGSAILYLFTFGVFGAGWLIDCIEMLLGCWRSRKKYLLPLQKKGKQLIKFLLVISAIIVLFNLIMVQ